jgi:hypothetical protein
VTADPRESQVEPVGASFPGWRVVAGAFIVLTTASGLGFYGLAVYLNAFSRERGWPVASLSLAATVFFVVSGASGVLVARVIARRDVRYVLVAGGVLGATSLLLLGRVDARWQLYVVYVAFGVSFACTGLVPATTVVTRWFHTRRSVALSVASTGLSAGGVLLTPAAKWLLDARGLADGTPILAAVWLIGIVPSALWLVRADPAPLGWLPDGGRSRPDAAPVALAGTPFAEAARTRFYAFGIAGYVLVLGSQVGGMQHIVKLAEERTSADAAAFATLVLALASIVARLVGGQVIGRLPMVAVAAGLALAQGVAMAWLALVHSPIGFFPAIVLFGVTVGNILMLQPLLIAERFGVLDYPRLYSRAHFITTTGVASGPYLVGMLHDHAGGYTTAYLVAAGLAAAGGMVLAAGGSARAT